MSNLVKPGTQFNKLRYGVCLRFRVCLHASVKLVDSVGVSLHKGCQSGHLAPHRKQLRGSIADNCQSDGPKKCPPPLRRFDSCVSLSPEFSKAQNMLVKVSYPLSGAV